MPSFGGQAEPCARGDGACSPVERARDPFSAYTVAPVSRDGGHAISKRADPDDKRQTGYVPTQKALDLLPVIFEMARWSARYDPRTDRESTFVQRMKADEQGFRRQILAQFKDMQSRTADDHRSA